MQEKNAQNNPSSEKAPEQKIAENPNPWANENIQATSIDEKRESDPGDDAGTEITDGEAG